ncbi:Hypothetical protein NTJ_05432 [Nesidiocoris tenuis]|uniref:Uncharacterized protein n=1 Tax=Nesidiocoris tenuis TaxID=355587 RepID=A0ABN7AK42_9HEMI|nr:Hypothetical protein NTJ_05432 [Nesidiocoris tenuis]
MNVMWPTLQIIIHPFNLEADEGRGGLYISSLCQRCASLRRGGFHPPADIPSWKEMSRGSASAAAEEDVSSSQQRKLHFAPSILFQPSIVV